MKLSMETMEITMENMMRMAIGRNMSLQVMRLKKRVRQKAKPLQRN